ncbi:MAG: hypothetical protein JXR97_13365, partial [Planctomycetes bacterium]|nr:hypothetical protein [Planctomycetota bacterium]
LINVTAAVAAGVVIASLVWYIQKRSLQSTFGDARRGLMFRSARDSLIRLAEMKEDSRNWRPTALVFCGNPTLREDLVNYGIWLEAGRGITYLANILVGDIEELTPRRRTALKQLEDFCDEKDIQAFPVAVAADSLSQGVNMLLQSVAIGPIKPNLAVFGWPRASDNFEAYMRQVRVAGKLDISRVIIKPVPLPSPDKQYRIDVWWRGQKNGAMMVMLAHLMTLNWEWANCEIRVLRVIENDAGREPAMKSMQELISNARLDANGVTLVSERPFGELLHTHSRDATCIFLGFEEPEEGREKGWHDAYSSFLADMPTTIMVNYNGTEDLLM